MRGRSNMVSTRVSRPVGKNHKVRLFEAKLFMCDDLLLKFQKEQRELPHSGWDGGIYRIMLNYLTQARSKPSEPLAVDVPAV